MAIHVCPPARRGYILRRVEIGPRKLTEENRYALCDCHGRLRAGSQFGCGWATRSWPLRTWALRPSSRPSSRPRRMGLRPECCAATAPGVLLSGASSGLSAADHELLLRAASLLSAPAGRPVVWVLGRGAISRKSMRAIRGVGWEWPRALRNRKRSPPLAVSQPLARCRKLICCFRGARRLQSPHGIAHSCS